MCIRDSEATRCSLEQSGFPLSCWPKAVRHQCFALNVSDDTWSRARGSAGDNRLFHPAEFGDATSMRGKLTAYERRHGEEYTGLDLPLGCRVRYRRPEPALKAKHKFDTPTRNGVFVGWDTQPGGVWQGAYIVADEEDLFNGIERLVTVKSLSLIHI